MFQEIYIAANHVSGKDLFWNPSRLAKGAGNILLLQALLDSVHLLELSALLVGRKKITLVSVGILRKVDGKPLLKDIEECADSKFSIGLLD